MEVTGYPDQFADFLVFLCEKYHVDRNRLFVEYSSNPPPPNLKSGDFNRHMRPPDDEAERVLDDQALKDLAEFQRLDHR